LMQTPFSKISIKLKEVAGRRKPIVRLDKQRDERTGDISFIYRISKSTSAEAEEFLIEDIEEVVRYRSSAKRRLFRSAGRPEVRRLKRRLAELFNLTWLSIHRSQSSRTREDEQSYDSSVDNKLTDLCNEFVRFFSELGQAASLETRRFQETVFLSMLVDEQKVEDIRTLRRMDLAAEKRLLVDIYNELELDPNVFQSRVEAHFKLVEEAFNRFEKNEITVEDFGALITNIRTNRIAQEWNNVTTKQDDIYSPRELFLELVNELMSGKDLSLNSKNELVAMLKNGDPLRLHDLSSGEKQMLIILGEALLQRSAAAIYIADEPELSLHVEWQETLVDNVRNLNPGAQILFATHSPDIVGEFSSRVHDVSEVLR